MQVRATMRRPSRSRTGARVPGIGPAGTPRPPAAHDARTHSAARGRAGAQTRRAVFGAQPAVAQPVRRAEPHGCTAFGRRHGEDSVEDLSLADGDGPGYWCGFPSPGRRSSPCPRPASRRPSSADPVLHLQDRLLLPGVLAHPDCAPSTPKPAPAPALGSPHADDADTGAGGSAPPALLSPFPQPDSTTDRTSTLPRRSALVAAPQPLTAGDHTGSPANLCTAGQGKPRRHSNVFSIMALSCDARRPAPCRLEQEPP